MSITRNSTTVPLKSMQMRDLHNQIVGELHSHELDVATDSINDDEFVLVITRNPLIKTVTSLHRYRHRPMEIEVNVDYNELKNTKDVLRITKPMISQQDTISYRWLWLLPVFSGLIVATVTLFEEFFASFFGSDALNSIQIIIIVTILSIILSISWIYGIPLIFKRRDQQRHEFDLFVLDIISKKIEAIDNDMITVEFIRCWSCFTELKPTVTVCTSCGEKQK